jgi:hypothetical protein
MIGIKQIVFTVSLSWNIIYPMLTILITTQKIGKMWRYNRRKYYFMCFWDGTDWSSVGTLLLYERSSNFRGIVFEIFVYLLKLYIHICLTLRDTGVWTMFSDSTSSKRQLGNLEYYYILQLYCFPFRLEFVSQKFLKMCYYKSFLYIQFHARV